jgi:hypothetical protein
MLLGLIAWVLATLFTLMLTIAVHPWVRTVRAHLNAATLLFLWIFFVTIYMFIMGVVGLLTPLPILISSVLGLLILGFLPTSRKALLDATSGIGRAAESIRRWWRSLPTWLRGFTILAISLSILRFSFLILALPPFVWDSLTYHLTNVAEWVQHGEIRTFETAVTRIYSPANYEVLTLWFTMFLHHDVIIEASGLPAYILGLLSVYSIARTLDISRDSAWIGTLAYATTPALLLAVTGTKNDPHMAAYYLYALALLSHLLSTPEYGKRKNTIGLLLVGFLAVMLALGTKTYLLHIAPGLVVIALLGVRPEGGWRCWGSIARAVWVDFRESGRGLRAFLIAMALAGVMLGLYWNLRNWVVVGNPFFPYSVTVSDIEVAEGVEQTVPFGFDRLLDNLELFAWKFGDRQGRVSPDLPDTTGWGWFAYSLGIATLLWGWLKRRDLRVLTIGFGLSSVVLFMSNRPSPWNMRYLLWLPAIFSFSFAAYLDRVPRRWVLHTFILLLVLLTMGANFLSVWNYARFDAEEFEQMLSIPIWEQSSARLPRDMPAEYKNTLGIVPDDAVLGYHVRGNGFIYPLYRPDYSQKLVFIPIDITGTCEDVAEAMAARGTRYLFVAPVHTRDEVLGFLHQCGEAAEVIQERSFNLYVLRD